jgi:hypothetical protein
MGFYEFDRIRSKNKIQNEAFEAYQELKQIGISDNLMLKLIANSKSINKDDLSRNEFYSCLENMIRGFRAEDQ